MKIFVEWLSRGVSQRYPAMVMASSLFCGTLDLIAQQAPPSAPVVVTQDACRFLTPVARDTLPPQPKPEIKRVLQGDEFELQLPSRDHLFRLESEQAFRDRLRQGLPKVKDVPFPKDAPFIPEATSVEVFPSQSVGPVFAPICYRPLCFEDKRTERFGQYVPCWQPLLSASRFYLDVLRLPCHMIAVPPWSFECDNR